MKYECLKLLKKRIFLVLTVCLFLSNFLLIYLQEHNREVYHYVYENRQHYAEFLEGKDAEYGADFYAQEQERQADYIEIYPLFLNEMEARADQLRELSVYTPDAYVYRNLERTCSDYGRLSGLEPEMGNNYGVEALSGYRFGIVFALCFLLLAAYYLIFDERNRGLFLLTKGTRRGRAPFAVHKGLTLCLAGICYVLIQEIGTILLYGFWYGYGRLGRSLQSVPIFRNCAVWISVGQFLIAQVLIRIWIAIIFSAILYLISMCIRNEIAAFLLTAVILGAEYAFSRIFSLSGSLNGVRCINPFFYWDMENVFGTYLNLNLCGYAVAKDKTAVAAGIILLAAAFVAGVYMFHRTCQIRSQSRLEKVLLLLRKRSAWQWRHTGLLRFEISKVVIGQKRGIVLLAFLIWCLSAVSDVNGVQYFATAEEMTYHRFLSEIHGRITDESMEYVDAQAAYMEEIYEQLAQLGEDDSQKNETIVHSLMHELEMKEDAVWRLDAQMNDLKSQKGSIYEKYFVDELAYRDIWADRNAELLRWFICACGIVIFSSGIHAFDQKKSLMSMLHSTPNGRKVLMQKKTIAGWIGACVLILFTEIPLLYRYWKIDAFSCAAHKMCDFTTMIFSSEMPLGMFLAIVLFMHILSLGLMTLIALKLSQLIQNELAACVVGIALTGCVTVLFYVGQTDISQIMLHLLQTGMG